MLQMTTPTEGPTYKKDGSAKEYYQICMLPPITVSATAVASASKVRVRSTFTTILRAVE
jgi:hypothetical protein